MLDASDQRVLRVIPLSSTKFVSHAAAELPGIALIYQPHTVARVRRKRWMEPVKTRMKYFGGLVCTFGGVYLGNAYGASYWRFGPLNLAWDTVIRGAVLVVIGMMLIRLSK